MKQVEWDRMIPDIRSNFPEPSVDRRDGSKDPKDAEPPLTAQAMAAKEKARAVRTESMIQTSAQSILAQAMEAETPVAALRYRQLRSKTPQPLQAEAAAEVGDISSTRRAALARANELRAARMAEEESAAENTTREAEHQDTSKPESAEVQTNEPEIRKEAESILASLLASTTPITATKAVRWRKDKAAIMARGGLKEDAALGGRRIGDRIAVEAAA